MIKIMNIKNLLLVIFQIILIIYSLETLLYLSLGDEQKLLHNIKGKRIELAKEMNLQYDIRDEAEVYLTEKKKNNNLYIPFFFHKSTFSTDFVKNLISKNNLVPFRGPINKQTLSCDESLNYKIINNDKYGFKNPNKVYENKIDIVLIGDSYTEGFCEDENNDVAGHLRKKNLNSVNLGVAGSGPLLSLAISREYFENLKPKYVVYLYFEGNDLLDLSWENTIFLKNYLQPEYKLNYISQNFSIQKTLEEFQKEKDIELSSREIAKNTYIKKGNNFFSIIKDILEIRNIKGILRSSILSNKNINDLNLFYEVVNSIKNEAELNGSKFIFIYLPSWSRYFEKFNDDLSIFNKKKEIIANIRSKGIYTIDFEEIFSKINNKKDFFPLGFIGHYNSAGYNLISIEIANEIKKQ